MQHQYPELNFKTIYPLLKFILEVQKDTNIITDAPYDDMTKSAILEIVTNKSVVSNKSLKDVDLEVETVRLYESMKNIELDTSDPKERIALIKLQSATLKDLLEMLKESKEIKSIKNFEDFIFSILTDEQKELVLKSSL